jgi:hypothetical protein
MTYIFVFIGPFRYIFVDFLLLVFLLFAKLQLIFSFLHSSILVFNPNLCFCALIALFRYFICLFHLVFNSLKPLGVQFRKIIRLLCFLNFANFTQSIGFVKIFAYIVLILVANFYFFLEIS